MDDMLKAISNVGFPIVACYFMYQQNTKLQGSLMSLIETLKSIDSRIEKLENKQ
jgi:hypothetical protein